MSNPHAAGHAAPRTTAQGFFALHLLLALLWSALMGWSLPHFCVGLLAGLVALLVGARAVGSATYLRLLVGTARLFGLFVWALVRANLQLARDILRRKQPFTPAILAFDVTSLGRLHTGLLVSLVSLTPGSLSIDLDPAEEVLFLHVLYARDERKARDEVQRYVDALRRISGQDSPAPEAG